MTRIEKSIVGLATIALLVVFYTMFNSVQAAESVSSTLTWVGPTQFTDGTDVGPDDIIGYNIYYTDDGTIPTTSSSVIPVNTETTFVHSFQLDPRPAPYIYTYAVTATASNGTESALSDTAMKQFLVKSSAPLNAPTGLSAQ